MTPEPIRFYNRYTQRIEVEKVYGGEFLQWVYTTPLGRLSLHLLIKRSLFSRFYGWLMDRPESASKIRPFIDEFGLNEDDFLEPVSAYQTFNQFFYRKLKPALRPIAQGEHVAIFPADGRHLGFQNIRAMDGIIVKGQCFKLEALFRDSDLAQRYANGSMVISRLCPVDYHRYYFPVSGVASDPRLINGDLYSVNPLALQQNIAIFCENKRMLSFVHSPQFGQVAQFDIGATCVGGIVHTYTPGKAVGKGEEKGFFRFGGSAMITLFEPGAIRLDDDLVEQSQARRELYAHMGDRLGEQR